MKIVFGAFSQISRAVVENSREQDASARFSCGNGRLFVVGRLATGLGRAGYVAGQFGIGLDQTQKAPRLVGREPVDQVMRSVMRGRRHTPSV